APAGEATAVAARRQPSTIEAPSNTSAFCMRSLEAHFLCVEVAMNNSSIMFDQLVKHFESHGDCVAPRAYVSTAYFQSLGDRLDRRQNGEWDVAPIGEGRNAIARLPILVEN